MNTHAYSHDLYPDPAGQHDVKMDSISSKKKVLIADDDHNLLTLLKMMLEEDFELTFSLNGSEAEQLIMQQHFDFCLMDINLPGKTGLEVCQSINESKLSNKPPVVVLSAKNDEATIKEAYKLGARDYICKPINVVAFHAHIIQFSRDLSHIEELEKHDKEAQTLAEISMRQASFYGQGLELISGLNSCFDENTMAKLVTDSLRVLGVNSAIQLRHGEQQLTYDVSGKPCSDVEIQVFKLLKEHGRIYHFGRRAIFNDQHVSILIKMMPEKGSVSYDAILDMVAKLVPALNARFLGLQHYLALLETKKSLLSIVELVNKGLADLEVEKREVLENIEAKIGLSFHELELQEYQERFFINLIEKELKAKDSGGKFKELSGLMHDCIDSLNVESELPGLQLDTANIQDVELF